MLTLLEACIRRAAQKVLLRIAQVLPVNLLGERDGASQAKEDDSVSRAGHPCTPKSVIHADRKPPVRYNPDRRQ
jgi:hypothetical protein